MYKRKEGCSPRTKLTLGLLAVSLLFTACSSPAAATLVPTEVLSTPTFPLPPGLTPDQLVPLSPGESNGLITSAGEFFTDTECVFPPVVLYRVPKIYIAPGVVQDAFVIPGKTPQDPMKIGLVSHADLSVDQAIEQDILDVAHEFTHLCNAKDPKPADRSTPLFSFTDEGWKINTTVYPTTRYENPGLTTDVIGLNTSSGEQQLIPVTGSLEELFSHSILDYLIERKGKTDLLTRERTNDPIQPGINFVRHALTTETEMQNAIKMMQTDDAKGAFDLLYGSMLRRGLNDGFITMKDGGAREQEMKFFFFLMLMRISNTSAPYAFDAVNYELDVKNKMSQMFYGNGKTFDLLTVGQGEKINIIFKDMFLQTPVIPSSSKRKTSQRVSLSANLFIQVQNPVKRAAPGIPLWNRRSMEGQFRPSKHRIDA